CKSNRLLWAQHSTRCPGLRRSSAGGGAPGGDAEGEDDEAEDEDEEDEKKQPCAAAERGAASARRPDPRMTHGAVRAGTAHDAGRHASHTSSAADTRPYTAAPQADGSAGAGATPQRRHSAAPQRQSAPAPQAQRSRTGVPRTLGGWPRGRRRSTRRG
ncbi:unnamed protein product, partial [Prorocentrum cordatum]